MGTLILLRHGESEWNRKNLFTGWVDIPLSIQGIEEALGAGDLISSTPIDYIYTSTLQRAISTAFFVMQRHSSQKMPYLLPDELKHHANWYTLCAPPAQKELIPMISAWELNERMYGDLQGCNKEEIKQRYGIEQFLHWRRSYNGVPPQGESLEMTTQRVLPYFSREIEPKVKAGQNVLLSAHGNSLRAILKVLDHLSEEEVAQLEVPTGEPLFYTF